MEVSSTLGVVTVKESPLSCWLTVEGGGAASTEWLVESTDWAVWERDVNRILWP